MARRLLRRDVAMSKQRLSIANLTSFCVEQKAQQNRVIIDLVGLQTYCLGGAAKSAAKPSFCNCLFKFLGTSVITVR